MAPFDYLHFKRIVLIFASRLEEAIQELEEYNEVVSSSKAIQ